jgi:hypothetical protein
LTFLGPTLLASAGDLASTLPPETLTELPHGGVVLRAATRPIVGVRSAPADVGKLPAIVRALGPLLGADKRTAPGKLEAERQTKLRALAAS